MREDRQPSFHDPEWDGFFPSSRADVGSGERDASANPNSPDQVIGEVGLVLVVVLGIVLAINLVLVAFHIV